MPADAGGAAPFGRTRAIMRAVLVVFYGTAGIVHIEAPAAFLPIMPSWVPHPVGVIILTGVCELAGVIGLVTTRWRWLAGVMLALYAVCVFPANLKHAFYGIDVPQLPHSWWYHGPRLAAQPLLVWWALFVGGVVDWPFRRGRQAGTR